MKVLITGSKNLLGSALSKRIENKNNLELINPLTDECDLEISIKL